MFHAPAAAPAEERAQSISYKSRLGVQMFIPYLVFYGGFVAINLLRPQWMAHRVLLGLNLAVAYGFSLIVVALVLAVIYNAACSRNERGPGSSAGGN